MSDGSRLPAFQFYPADWSGNSNLRRCTHEEKGIWVDVMCVLHDQREYGVVRWPLSEIATAVGTTIKKLRGLVSKGVLKGADADTIEPFIYTPRSGRKDGEPVTLIPEQDGPLWYSSRMVKDAHIRRVRGGSTRFTADDEGSPDKSSKGAPDKSPKPPLGASKGDGSSSASSSSSAYAKDNLPPPEAQSGAPDGAGPAAGVDWVERVEGLHAELGPLLDGTSPNTRNASTLRKLVEREGIGWPDVRDAVVAIVKTYGTKSRPIRSFNFPPIIDMAHANHQRRTNPENRDANGATAHNGRTAPPRPEPRGFAGALARDKARREAEAGQRADELGGDGGEAIGEPASGHIGAH